MADKLITVGSEVRVICNFPYYHKRLKKVIIGPDYIGKVGVVLQINRSKSSKFQYYVAFADTPPGRYIPFQMGEVELA